MPPWLLAFIIETEHKVAQHGLLASTLALPHIVWPLLSYMSSLYFSFFNSKMKMRMRIVMMVLVIVVRSNWIIWGVSELTHVKYLAQFLEVSKLYVRAWHYYCHYQNRKKLVILWFLKFSNWISEVSLKKMIDIDQYMFNCIYIILI